MQAGRACGLSSGAALVAAAQAGVAALVTAIAAIVAGESAALPVAAGGVCALGGTVVAGLCLRWLPQRGAAQVLRAQIVAQAAKAAVALTLLIAALNAVEAAAAGLLVAGFASAVLAYPFALLMVNTKTDRN